jgi:hypothetical protein
MKRAILLSALCAAALGGCGKATTTSEAVKTTTAADASKPAAAEGPARPTMKAGLWSQTMAMPGMNQTMKVCMDEPAAQKARWWSGGPGKSDCAEERVTPHPGGGWDFHSVCKAPDGQTTTSDGSATGDFGSHYKVEVTSVTSGAATPEANGTHKIAIEATWQGPCPAGMGPGDMEMAGGMRISAHGGMTGGPGAGMKYDANHMPSQADIAKMRAQAMEMAKGMKDQAK